MSTFSPFAHFVESTQGFPFILLSAFLNTIATVSRASFPVGCISSLFSRLKWWKSVSV